MCIYHIHLLLWFISWDNLTLVLAICTVQRPHYHVKMIATLHSSLATIFADHAARCFIHRSTGRPILYSGDNVDDVSRFCALLKPMSSRRQLPETSDRLVASNCGVAACVDNSTEPTGQRTTEGAYKRRSISSKHWTHIFIGRRPIGYCSRCEVYNNFPLRYRDVIDRPARFSHTRLPRFLVIHPRNPSLSIFPYLWEIRVLRVYFYATCGAYITVQAAFVVKS